MTKPMTFDGETMREMNEAELAQHEIDLAEWQTQTEAKVARTAARAALLNRLGITAEEAQLLLGGM